MTRLFAAVWRRLWRTLGAGCLVAAVLGAQASDGPSCPPTAEPLSVEDLRTRPGDAPDRGFLWRVEHGGHASFLYGTVHVGRREWMASGPITAQAIAASDTVALEIDMLDLDLLQRLARAMLAGPDERLPAALAERLRQQEAAACLPERAMAALSPAVRIAALATQAARVDGLDPAYSVDVFLAGLARALGKRVVSLETPEAQIALLKDESVGGEAAIDRVLSQLESGRARALLQRTAQAWADGDADTLARYEQWCECVETDADRRALKRLLDDRNLALADRIAALHAAGERVFAGVGALHMIGPLGLPALMTARGFRVQRLAFGR